MSKKPWYPFFPADFRSSPRVQTLTLEQEACLRRLLDIQWLSEDCTIPDNMQMHCSWTSNAMQEQCTRDAVLQFFPIIEDGKRANLRLRELFFKASDTSRERKKAAETRWNKPKTKSKKKKDANASVLQCDSDSDSDSNNTPISPNGDFEKFWNAYPRKSGKGKAWESWDKIKPNAQIQSRILEAITEQSKTEQWKKDKGQYIPFPATWLNQKRWEDSPEIVLAEKQEEYDWSEYKY